MNGRDLSRLPLAYSLTTRPKPQIKASQQTKGCASPSLNNTRLEYLDRFSYRVSLDHSPR